MNETIRVLLVDGCPTLRLGLRHTLEQSADVVIVGEAENSIEALAKIEALWPEVVLWGCDLPRIDDKEVASAVRQMSLKTRVLVFSDHSDDKYAKCVIEAGAVGYVLRDEPIPRITEAIKAVA